VSNLGGVRVGLLRHCLLVSVDQTTRQRINYFYGNEAISMNEHRAPTY